MYICIYKYIYVHIYVHITKQINKCIYKYINLHIYVYIHIHTWVAVRNGLIAPFKGGPRPTAGVNV
jgi:hypothetical protein